ncbi:hypothetical protein AMC90_PD00040 (plasmid) [Rhizobium phaseoli]|uniref:hypothetical protein n=1 Tax=Rhizobium phaseoli TaxID=396 RepID=UPI0007F126CD|nr:hypothetical protein [Rhizobium phaseoli]ANL31066.1 hypothetical protein AMC90_PD00040 [Rhizobium phaseoli]ANL68999.1 hypothetical protein AMC84_PD00040 [Rhizobium phaseoli]ANL75454.1 hypothetical protein AMC83_PE00040 [Rhizobium phaseoli]ANL81798.1 hypothetical protein AMC82_PD00040 [Rhizobium phaseoli]
MKRPKDDPAPVNGLSAEQQRNGLKTLWLAVALFATTIAIAFLLYVSILVYAVMQRM